LKLKSKINTNIDFKEKTLSIKLSDNKNTAIYLSVHEPNRIVRSKSKNYVTNSHIIDYKLNVKTEHLLPPPFETNFFNYPDNIGRKDLPKSYEECKDQCSKIRANDQKFKCKCKRDCMIETFDLDLEQTISLRNKRENVRKTHESISIRRKEREEHFYDLPAMSLTEY